MDDETDEYQIDLNWFADPNQKDLNIDGLQKDIEEQIKLNDFALTQ